MNGKKFVIKSNKNKITFDTININKNTWSVFQSMKSISYLLLFPEQLSSSIEFLEGWISLLINGTL